MDLYGVDELWIEKGFLLEGLKVWLPVLFDWDLGRFAHLMAVWGSIGLSTSINTQSNIRFLNLSSLVAHGAQRQLIFPQTLSHLAYL